MPNLDDAYNMRRLVEAYSTKQVRFFINEIEVPAMFEIGNGEIHIKQEKGGYGRKCVTLIAKENTLYLDNYYAEADIKRCPGILHGMFFKLVDCIARSLEYPSISLTDQSSQTIRRVVIPRDVLALSKSQTFYNRYGYINEDYTRELFKLQREIAIERIPHAFLGLLPGYDPSMTLQDVATLIVTLSKAGHTEEELEPIIEGLQNLPELKSIIYFVKQVHGDISYKIRAGRYLEVRFSEQTGGARKKRVRLKSLKRAYQKMRKNNGLFTMKSRFSAL